MMIVEMIPVVGREELWSMNLAKKAEKICQGNTKKKKKAVSDWDNGTGDCVDENGIPFENNSSNMKL